MTIPDVTRRNDSVGNSVTTVFAYSFKIADKSEIYALVDGVLRTVDVDYSVQNVGVDGGGTVTFSVAPGVVNVSLMDQTAYSQLSVYNPNEDFPSQRVADDLDKHTRLFQQIRERFRRTFGFSKKSLLVDYEVDDPTPGLFLRAKNPAPGFDWASVVTAGAISIPVPLTQGGTGQITAALARAAIFDPILTTKGDLVAASGVGAASRLAVGTNGQVLTADSTQPTGLKYATPVVPTGVTFIITPESGVFPTTSFPTLTKNSLTNWTDYTLDYINGATTGAFWYVAIPPGISFTTAAIEIYSRQAAAITGTLGWKVTSISRGDADAWDTAGVTDTLAAAAVKGTAGQVFRQTMSLTVTGWAVSRALLIKIERNGTVDTCAEASKFIKAAIRLT